MKFILKNLMPLYCESRSSLSFLMNKCQNLLTSPFSQKSSGMKQAFIKQTIKLTEEPFNPTIGSNIVLVEDPEGHHLITGVLQNRVIACSQI